MNRKQAKLFFAQYRRGTLNPKLTAELRGILESDAALRDAYETDTRLENLIALKRYEKPHPSTFDTFLAEFHRRQRAELVESRSVWTWIRDTVENHLFQPASAVLQYSGVAALFAILVGLSLTVLPRSPRGPSTAVSSMETIDANTGVSVVATADPTVANVPVVLANHTADVPVTYVLQRVNNSPGPNAFTHFDF